MGGVASRGGHSHPGRFCAPSNHLEGRVCARNVEHVSEIMKEETDMQRSKRKVGEVGGEGG